MATGLEAAVPVKEIALSNTSFGPQEIRAITSAIAEDYSQHSVLRNAVAELVFNTDDERHG